MIRRKRRVKSVMLWERRVLEVHKSRIDWCDRSVILCWHSGKERVERQPWWEMIGGMGMWRESFPKTAYSLASLRVGQTGSKTVCINEYLMCGGVAKQETHSELISPFQWLDIYLSSWKALLEFPMLRIPLTTHMVPSGHEFFSIFVGLEEFILSFIIMTS